MMIASTYRHGFPCGAGSSAYYHPETSSNPAVTRTDQLYTSPTQNIHAFSSEANSFVSSVSGQNSFQAANNGAGNIDASIVNSPEIFSYNPASNVSAPGLANVHYMGGVETSPHYQISGFDAKTANNDLMWSGGYGPATGYSHGPQHASQYPFNTRYCGVDFDESVRRKNATRESTNTLKAWLQEHKKNPYPTKGEKIMLAIITKMTLTQVSTWFANARRRLKKENKMTWIPKNRSSDSNNPNSKKSEDEDDNESQHSQNSDAKSCNDSSEDHFKEDADSLGDLDHSDESVHLKFPESSKMMNPVSQAYPKAEEIPSPGEIFKPNEFLGSSLERRESNLQMNFLKTNEAFESAMLQPVMESNINADNFTRQNGVVSSTMPVSMSNYSNSASSFASASPTASIHPDLPSCREEFHFKQNPITYGSTGRIDQIGAAVNNRYGLQHPAVSVEEHGHVRRTSDPVLFPQTSVNPYQSVTNHGTSTNFFSSSNDLRGNHPASFTSRSVQGFQDPSTLGSSLSEPISSFQRNNNFQFSMSSYGQEKDLFVQDDCANSIFQNSSNYQRFC